MNSNHFITIIAITLVFAGYFKLNNFLLVSNQGSDYDELFMESRETFSKVVEILSNHPAIIRISQSKNNETVRNANKFSEKDWAAYRLIKDLMDLVDIFSSTSLGDEGVVFLMPYPILNDSRLDRICFLSGARDIAIDRPNTLCRPLDINWYLCSTWICSEQMEEEKASMGMSGDPLNVKQCSSN